MEGEAWGQARIGRSWQIPAIQSRRPTPFPFASRPARRCTRLSMSEHEAIMMNSAAPTTFAGPTSRAACEAPTSWTMRMATCNEAPTSWAARTAARLEPPNFDLGTNVSNLQEAAASLQPPTNALDTEEPILQGAHAHLEPPTADLGRETASAARDLGNETPIAARTAPTLGMAAHASIVASAPTCPLSTVALPSTCRPSTVALPAAAASNGLASFNHVASSPCPLAAHMATMMGPRPPFAKEVVGMGGFSSPPTMAELQTPPEASTDFATFGIFDDQNCTGELAEIFYFSARVWAAPPHQSTSTVPLPLQPSLSWPPAPPLPSIGAAPTTSPPEILIGNVPLKPCPNLFVSDDKIAAAFHNSSRKTLTYIPPSVQNSEVLVRPTIDIIREGSNRWNTTAVGYFLGKRPYFHHLNEFVRSIWPAVRDVKATSNGFFFFNLKQWMEEVLEGGPWLYLGQPIVLQKWEPGMVLRKLKHTEVPVWIKLRHLPVELWTTDGLSTVASGIGRPLYVK
ncbi:UNVERIFIED_CONTAM: hypothetical protein Sangu_3237900 [Sesamum angustifolium]|uniref:DUF4283 domain-containing protein n=1 Tax=Sesamum angustifolium TaxID=2727405 RepID=A0AAW2JIQ4_9LAMI